MEENRVYQGIGYAPLRLRNENDNNYVGSTDLAVEVGGSIIASFTVSTIEELVDLFYRRPDELSYSEFTSILSESIFSLFSSLISSSLFSTFLIA